jgi:hypothetical protein
MRLSDGAASPGSHTTPVWPLNGAGHDLSRPSDGTIHHIEGVEGVVGGGFVEARAGKRRTNFFAKEI